MADPRFSSCIFWDLLVLIVSINCTLMEMKWVFSQFICGEGKGVVKIERF